MKKISVKNAKFQNFDQWLTGIEGTNNENKTRKKLLTTESISSTETFKILG